MTFASRDAQGGHGKGGPTVNVLMVDVRSELDQILHDATVPHVSCRYERGPALFVGLKSHCLTTTILLMGTLHDWLRTLGSVLDWSS